jgi:hypothetical protein
MNQLPDRLYALLPAMYRIRDADQGSPLQVLPGVIAEQPPDRCKSLVMGPLQALLRVIAEQVNIVEDDITQLYENWFIETCEDWVVP